MKKIFSKFEKNEKIDNPTKETSNYVGKVFVVGRVSVTVEDTLAEGISKFFYRDIILFNESNWGQEMLLSLFMLFKLFYQIFKCVTIGTLDSLIFMSMA